MYVFQFLNQYFKESRIPQKTNKLFIKFEFWKDNLCYYYLPWAFYNFKKCAMNNCNFRCTIFIFSDRLCRWCYSSHDLKFLTGFEFGTEAAISRSPASTASTASGQGDQTLCSQTTQDPSCTCGLFLWTWFEFRGDFRYVYFFEIESKKIICRLMSVWLWNFKDGGS